MKKLLLGLAPLALMLASPAHADTQSYLDMVAVYGMNVTPETTPTLITVGNSICADLREGGNPDTETKAMFRLAPALTEKQSGNLVSAAQLKLCPDTL